MLIFVSHSTRDKPFARQLKKELEARHLNVWLDEAEIRVGQSIPQKIGEAVTAADVFCILLSDASVSSRWVDRELNAFIPRWIAGDATLLPCRLDACTLPSLIRDIKYADFSQSFDTGLTQLLLGVAVREELAATADFQAVRTILLNELSPPNLAFLVHHFGRSDHYFVADRRDTKYPIALDAFSRVGALDVIEDRYEATWGLTEKGKRLLTILEPDAPADLLQRWDREIGPRKGKA